MDRLRGAAPGIVGRDGRLPGRLCCRRCSPILPDDPHAIVAWAATASPREYGTFTTRIVDYAARGDACAPSN